MDGDLVPGYEGANIAAEILDASDSLRELCSKCGQKLAGQTPLLTCTGACLPRISFHKCVPQSRRTDPTFKCLFCDPSHKDDFCLSCNQGPTTDIKICSRNINTGCTNFVHRACLKNVKNAFYCGLC